MENNLATAVVELGPHQKMVLDAEMLQVLTAGDKVRMEELLARGNHHGAGDGHARTEGQVAINVHGTAPAAALAAPRPGMSCLLGVTSNGNTALHLVASRGHVELATLICERAPSLVATRNKFLDTPLHCSAKSGHRAVAAVLLSKMKAGGEEESTLRARNQMGATALYEAVRHGHLGVVDLLMTEAPELASIATADHDGVSPPYLAVDNGSVQMVRALLRPSQNGTPSPAAFSGPDGRNALHCAAAHSKELAQAILGWEPEGPTLLTRVDSSGSTPLHFAVLYRRLDVVKLFLDGHASLELASISGNDGSFPVHIAAMVGETRIIDELTNRCPNLYELVDDKGRNLLHRAVDHGQEVVVRHICQNDMFVMLLNAMDSEGNTPLHLAVKCGFPRIFVLLLETTNVKIGITNKDGLTAGDLSLRARAPDQIYYFLDPCTIARNCLMWLRAPITLEGIHPIYLRELYNKPTEEEASRQTDRARTGTIGPVLIATVAFAAAFTVPGGFIADDHARAGTAILARRFAFRAFVVSDTMAFVCSIIGTSLLIYGGAKEIPRNHRFRYNLLAFLLVPAGAIFMIAAFAFGFHLVLGAANRLFIVFVYIVSFAAVLFCFPGIWDPLHIGLGKATWRRAGCRGLVNIHKRPSSLRQLLRLFTTSFLFENLTGPLFVLLVSATFVVAVVLSIALPNY